MFEAKNQINISEAFADLLSIMLIGLFIENVVPPNRDENG
jgi:hypothetical protein